MKATKIILMMSFTMVMGSCCNNLTSSVECEGDNSFTFKILSNSGEDLFFAENPKYQVSDLKIIGIQKNDQVDISISNGYDFLLCPVNYKYEAVVIEIKGQPRDTLKFDCRTEDDACCGKETRIETIYVDGQEIEFPYMDPINIKVPD